MAEARDLGVAAGGAARSAAEQYEELRHMLPRRADPGTPRPSPEQLVIGARLRVEWSGSWWAARVKEERGAEVKIGFDTWSESHDEWLPKDSGRLRLAVPGEKDAEAEVAAIRAASPRPAAAAGSSDADQVLNAVPKRARPYVPKPYNPEKEFQKRQLRLREKIAAMQRAKVGSVDPALVEVQERARRTLEEEGELAPGELAPGFISSMTAPASATPVPPAPPVSAPAQAPALAATPRAAPASPPPPPPPPPPQPPAVDRTVRWHEVLSDSQERYYHEVATGRTQWELPSDGWVQLLADDGSVYFWHATSGQTQWTSPA